MIQIHITYFIYYKFVDSDLEVRQATAGAGLEDFQESMAQTFAKIEKEIKVFSDDTLNCDDPAGSLKFSCGTIARQAIKEMSDALQSAASQHMSGQFVKDFIEVINHLINHLKFINMKCDEWQH